MSKERHAQYLLLFEKIGVRGLLHMSDGEIKITVASTGTLNRGASKGIAYTKRDVTTVAAELVVDAVAVDKVAYRSLGVEHWYVYLSR